MAKLNKEFYLRTDVVKIARELLGKKIVTNINGKLTSGIITETESYEGAIDKASHAYNNKKTPRTNTMFLEGGVCYIYLCYGIHHLLNVVTGPKETPHAVLIRSIEPLDGIDTIFKRRNQSKISKNLTAGPGILSQALGITTAFDKESLLGNKIWIEDSGLIVTPKMIKKCPRIGVDYADDHALWNYRFYIKGNKFVSKII